MAEIDFEISITHSVGAGKVLTRPLVLQIRRCRVLKLVASFGISAAR